MANLASPSGSRGSRRGADVTDLPPPAGVRLASLIEQSACGDEEAFAALYDATAARVYGLAVRVLRDPAQAEEVIQEAYLHLWTHAARFDPARGGAISWILMVAHGQAVSRVRSSEARVRRDATYVRHEAMTRPQPEDSPYEAVNASMEACRVRDALSEISSIQREAIELAYFGGHTAAEVARMTSVPESTAKTRIRDGLIKLHKVLGDR